MTGMLSLSLSIFNDNTGYRYQSSEKIWTSNTINGMYEEGIFLSFSTSLPFLFCVNITVTR